MTPDGVLIVNKHAGATSHDIVNRVRRLYGTKSVGHAGTLDPMAEGVLTVLIGRAVKASEYLCGAENGRKRYSALLRLGLVTDTDDVTGETLSETAGPLPGMAEVEAALPRFTGEIAQVPPMYSALKRDGRKLCDLARRGVTLELEPRPIKIFSLTAVPTSVPSDYALEVECSAGTYIRALCRDIGRALGCGGTMAALTRTEANGFAVSESVTVDALESLDAEGRLRLLRPVETLFADCPEVSLPKFFADLAHSGAEIYLAKLNLAFAEGTRVRLADGEGFFALGEVRAYPDGPAIKPIKQFRLAQ